ncbi:leucyl aminopeptidase [Candidatus Kinetoplastibacterium blastocrithidii TCC012E]|uniref:Probable cytosol aminopeptidase n=1 Tax=Candidatus Kinetoplastidibacterium blastocrithidiae TCC012E TaxID=1208922 RepID=M1LBQ2_9PROT|nr:leucyl aminopeptidase [Candidatus Kinetoplastibacterium blastocrithidii]AFZ83755.1 leucyl aminopeptidase [Candidatus Kinetoplastibacterium blastocrithidii (ex Strigomonas culicis)]AGF49878.1 leucyl aminopeptidase [Candidatus Kinetoplastibacterium blastocrithidii TCC012E]
MEINISNNINKIHEIQTEAISIGIFSDEDLINSSEITRKIDSDTIINLIKNDFQANIGQIIVLYNINNILAKRIILVGLGKKTKFSVDNYIRAEETLVKTCISHNISEYCSALIMRLDTNICKKTAIRNAVISIKNATYKYTETISEKENKKIRCFTIVTNEKDQEKIKNGADEGNYIANGISLSRKLADLPSNICTPSHIAKTAKELADEFDSISVNIMDYEQVYKLGMRAFISVAKGSKEPLKFIEIMYKSNKKNNKDPIVIIGKGITFDSGGISLKPSNSMHEMKYDMCGASTVIGLFKVIPQLKIDRDIIGLIPACENMPSGNSNKPGDVVSSMSGKTIEIINTDAEGRLILCDALTYAKKFNPDLVIDIATLTGACVIALGNVYTGLFSNNDEIAKKIIRAGKSSKDPVWRMPVDISYLDLLKSNFADLSNTGGASAGAITAACFLSEFAETYKWAHLDIAGTAWKKNNKGSTGRPIPLLVNFLIDINNGN